MRVNIATVACSIAVVLVVPAGAAGQLPPRPADVITGSDTFDVIMDQLIFVHGLTPFNGASGIGTSTASYLGIGSGAGQRQMEGAPNAQEPRCGGTAATEVGCQEIAPMSSKMTNAVCNDAEAAGRAEGLVVCDDGVSVLTDNSSMKGRSGLPNACTSWRANNYAASNNNNPPLGDDFSNIVGPLGNPVALPASGYLIGANGVPAWRDVLRVIYTGCRNSQADCVAAIDRLARCTDPVRAELIGSWNAIVAGTDCSATGTCLTGLRRAYRLDDSSGTSAVFLGMLGVSANLTGRPKVFSNSLDCTNVDNNRCCDNDQIRIWGIPGDHAFCDGGSNENFLPDCHNGVFAQVGGDPIRKPCAPEDDICDLNGQGGVVQAIAGTPPRRVNVFGSVIDEPFATHQCGHSMYKFNAYVVPTPATLTICPDGTAPSAGDNCNLPEFQVGGVTNTRNCMANALSKSPAVGAADGRAYNALRRNAAGAIEFSTAGATPRVPTWRMNAYRAVTSGLDPLPRSPGFDIAAQNRQECTADSATRQIGCIVSKTTCSIGFAGRGAVYTPVEPSASLGNEPFSLQNLTNPANYLPPRNANIGAVPVDQRYPLQRPLYVQAIGGFENMSADCTARIASATSSNPGTDQAWCDDQLSIAQAFFDIDLNSDAYRSCEWAGYVPRTVATRECVSALDGAGCGPADPNPGVDDDGDGVTSELGEQPITACLPM